MKKYYKSLVISENEMKDLLKGVIIDAIKEKCPDVSPFQLLEGIRYTIAEIFEITFEDEGVNGIIVIDEENKTYNEFVSGMDIFEHYEKFIYEIFKERYDEELKNAQHSFENKNKERKEKLASIIIRLAEIMDNPEFLVMGGNIHANLDAYNIDYIIEVLANMINYIPKHYRPL